MAGDEVQGLKTLIESVRATRAKVRTLSDQSWRIVERATKILSEAGAHTAVVGNKVKVRIDAKTTLEVTLRKGGASAAGHIAFDRGPHVQTPGWIDATIEKNGDMRHIETIAIIDAKTRMDFEIVRYAASEGDADTLNHRCVRGGRRSAVAARARRTLGEGVPGMARAGQPRSGERRRRRRGADRRRGRRGGGARARERLGRGARALGDRDVDGRELGGRAGALADRRETQLTQATQTLLDAVRNARWGEAQRAVRAGTPLATGRWEENALAIALREGGLTRASDARALLDAEEAFVHARAGTRSSRAARERADNARGLLEALIDAGAAPAGEGDERAALATLLVAHGARADAGCAAYAGAKGATPALANAIIDAVKAGEARDEAAACALEEALAKGHIALAQALMAQRETLRMSERTVRRALAEPETGLGALARVLASDAVGEDDVTRMDREGPLTLVALVCTHRPRAALERHAVQIIETLRRKGADIGGARTASDPLTACLRARWNTAVDAVIAWQRAPRGAPLARVLARYPPRRSPESEACVRRWLARAVRDTGTAAQHACDATSGRSCLTEAAAREDARWLLAPLIDALGRPDARDAQGRTALGECAREASAWARAGERARALGASDHAERIKEAGAAAQAQILVAKGADPWAQGEGGRSAAQHAAGSLRMLEALEIAPGALGQGRARSLAHAACDAARGGAPRGASATLRWMAEAGCPQATEEAVVQRLRDALGTDPAGRVARERDSATMVIAALCDPDKPTVLIDARGVHPSALHPLEWATDAGANLHESARSALENGPAEERARLEGARVWIANEGTDPALLEALEEAFA